MLNPEIYISYSNCTECSASTDEDSGLIPGQTRSSWSALLRKVIVMMPGDKVCVHEDHYQLLFSVHRPYFVLILGEKRCRHHSIKNIWWD